MVLKKQKLLIIPDFDGEDYIMAVLHPSQNDSFTEQLIKTTGILPLRSSAAATLGSDHVRPYWHTELELRIL